MLIMYKGAKPNCGMAECNIITVFGNNLVGIYFLEPSQVKALRLVLKCYGLFLLKQYSRPTYCLNTN